MTIRTDIHRPSAINPEAYNFVAMELVKFEGLESALFMRAEREALRTHMAHTGGTYSTHAHGGNCHVCGNANAIYTALFHHAETNTYIRMGQDCAAKCDMGNAEAFRSFRAKVAGARESLAGKNKAQLILADDGLSAAWDIYLAPNGMAKKWEENTITDIVGKLVKYGSISEKQTAFLHSLVSKIDARASVEAARAVVAATSVYVGTVGARVTMDLTVRAVPSFDSMYGLCYISICGDAAGNTVVYRGAKPLADRGETVKVLATIKAHDEYKGERQTIIARPKRAA